MGRKYLHSLLVQPKHPKSVHVIAAENDNFSLLGVHISWHGKIHKYWERRKKSSNYFFSLSLYRKRNVLLSQEA
jgi:hypothetical protein